MKLSLKIKEIPLSDIVVKVLPIVKKKFSAGAMGTLMEGIDMIPDEAFCNLLDAIPPAKLNEIISAFVEEKQEKIMGIVGKLIAKKGLPLEVKSINISKDLLVDVVIGDLDYAALANKFVPADKFYSGLAKKILTGPSQEKKDNFIIGAVSKFKGKIIGKIRGIAMSKGIEIDVEDLSISK